MAIKDRHRVMPAAYVILKQGNKILLQLRANTGYEDGKYSLVAGHVEAGETYTEAIIREAREEAGVELSEKDLKPTHFLHRKSDGEDNERADLFFVAEVWGGEIQNMEPHKCDELAWFAMDELPENVIPYIRETLGRIEEGILYSEYGWE